MTDPITQVVEAARLPSRRSLLSAIPGSLALLGGCTSRFSPTLDQVRDRGALRVGVTQGAPWFEFDPQTGRWDGIGLRIADLLANDLGVTCVPVETSWSQAVSGLQSNHYDLMPVLDPSKARRLAVDFPDTPLFGYAMGAITTDRIAAAAWQDFNRPGLRIGVAMGTAGAQFATDRMPRADILRFTSIDETSAAFAAGRIDAIVFYFPALVAQAARIKLGRLSLPVPIVLIPTSAGIRHETDGRWRHWLGNRLRHYHVSGAIEWLFVDYASRFTANPEKAFALARRMMGQSP